MAVKTVKIEGSIKNPLRPITKAQYDKMTEKKKKTTSKSKGK